MRRVLVAADRALGPFPAALLRAWSDELDAVEERLAAVPPLPAALDAQRADAVPGGGLHAWVALAGARCGDAWVPGQLVDVAVATELAHRAVCAHSHIAGSLAQPPPSDGVRRHNQRQVLRGDWAITEAANLVADIDAAAYRLLVRGYGVAQLARLRGTPDPAVLVRTAWSLGALVAGVLVIDPSGPVVQWAADELSAAMRRDSGADRPLSPSVTRKPRTAPIP